MKSLTAMRSLAYLLIIGLFYHVAVAQTSQVAQVSGRVVDGSGAAIVGAHVSMTNVDTGLIRATDTGDNGSYNLTTLPIGTYRLEAAKEGFGKYVQSGIVLDVNTNPTIGLGTQRQ